MSALATAQTPFFFLVDFELQKPVICHLKDAKSLGFEFEIKGFRNFNTQDKSLSSRTLSIDPVPKEVYANSFRKVVEEIYKGNTFAQPTFPAIHANLKLRSLPLCQHLIN